MAVNPDSVGQIAVPVEDVERATAFYRDVLGLEFLFSAPPGLAFFRCGEVRLMLSRPEGGGGGASLVYYRVDDTDAAHDELRSAGATVVHEPSVVHRDDAVELRIGFYRDSEDNLFGVMEERRSGGGAGP